MRLRTPIPASRGIAAPGGRVRTAVPNGYRYATRRATSSRAASSTRHRGRRRHGGVDRAECPARLEMHLDHAVRPRRLEVALDPRHRLVVAAAQPADAVGAVAAVELRHVERHVDEAHRALPRQVDVLRRQRHRRVADRRRDANEVALVLDRLRSRRLHDARRDLVQLVGGGRRNEHQKLLAAPADDHVRLAQRVAQPAGDGDEHRIAGGVADSGRWSA